MVYPLSLMIQFKLQLWDEVRLVQQLGGCERTAHGTCTALHGSVWHFIVPAQGSQHMFKHALSTLDSSQRECKISSLAYVSFLVAHSKVSHLESFASKNFCSKKFCIKNEISFASKSFALEFRESRKSRNFSTQLENFRLCLQRQQVDNTIEKQPEKFRK